MDISDIKTKLRRKKEKEEDWKDLKGHLREERWKKKEKSMERKK